MGLTRTSSGLLVRDEFSSDSSGDYYPTSGNTIAVASGELYASAANSGCARKTYNTAKCITALGEMDDDYGNGAAYYANENIGSAAAWDGYKIHYRTAGAYLSKYVDGSATDLANIACGYLGTNTVHTRVYLTATGVTGRIGVTAFTHSGSSTDTTYTAAAYGGLHFRKESAAYGIQWLDIRTSHLITCTGMTTGHYLRVSDGTTAAEAQESGGTATVDAGAVLFPLASVQIRTAAAGGGDLIAELTSTDYADMGGGDAFAYSASSVWLPQLIVPQCYPSYGGLTYG